MTPQEVLLQSLELMNDEGKHWIKHRISDKLEDGSMGFCSIGAIIEAGDGDPRLIDEAIDLIYGPILKENGIVTITQWNDAPETTWEDVKRVFQSAVGVKA